MDKESVYAKIDLYNDSVDRLSTSLFDNISWNKWFNKYKSEKNSNAVRAMRKLISESTIQACEKGKYKLMTGEIVLLPEIKTKCTLYETTRLEDYENSNLDNQKHATMQVIEQDSLDAAIHLKNLGCNPAVLIMASMSRPGGGYRNGAGGQEENLFRRTNLNKFMDNPDFRKRSYPLPEFGGIYTSNAIIFRSSEDTGYAFLPEPIEMSFIGVAAYSHPQTEKVGNKLMISYKMAEKTKSKIRTILNIAIMNGHNAVVLGAFGCGVFENPPEHMAQLFKEVIENEYSDKLLHIVFPILEDHNSRKQHNPRGNLLPFKEVFNSLNINKNVVEKKEEEKTPSSGKEEQKDVPDVIQFYSPNKDFGFLSIFSTHSIVIKNKTWPTVKHYYEAQKFAGTSIEEEIRNAKNTQQVNNISIKHEKSIKPGWSERKDFVLQEALLAKFQQYPELKEQLLATGTSSIVFHSNDNYLGDAIQGHGKNVLGKMLVQIRSQLKE